MAWEPEPTHRQLGDFVLQDLIGQRVSMEIYRATQQSLKRFVQLKILSFESISQDADVLMQEFESYVQGVIGLEHMHLQPIYGYGVIDERHVYIAGRFMSGTLHDLLLQGALPRKRALELGLQIVSALAYIHASGFVHSSLTPHNIYLDGAGSAYIDDLEVSQVVQSAKTLDELATLIDEPFYAAVEQLQCQPVDFRSEVHSYGAILYHMLTGRPPFYGDDNTFPAVLQRKLRRDVIPPRQLNPEISRETESIILRALSPNPDERFPHAGAVEAELKILVNAPLQSLAPAARTLTERVRSLLSRGGKSS